MGRAQRYRWRGGGRHNDEMWLAELDEIASAFIRVLSVSPRSRSLSTAVGRRTREYTHAHTSTHAMPEVHANSTQRTSNWVRRLCTFRTPSGPSASARDGSELLLPPPRLLSLLPLRLLLLLLPLALLLMGLLHDAVTSILSSRAGVTTICGMLSAVYISSQTEGKDASARARQPSQPSS
jgi:hypothetical protein